MSGFTFNLGRISQQTLNDRLLGSVRTTQQELAETQQQISTGRKFQRPSDGPSSVSAIVNLEESIASRDRYIENLRFGLDTLNNTGEALSQANDVLLEAKSVALSQIGVGSDADTRQSQAVVVDALIQSVTEIANRQVLDLSIFGGNNGAAPDENVFVPFLGGIRYVGGDTNLQGQGATGREVDLVSNGLDAFGALSSRVKTQVDLQPQATATTLLSDLEGATFDGVSKGSITVTVNATPVTVDLTDADSMGDVVDRVNDAIDSVSVGAGSLAVSGDGFTLTGVGGNTVAISDVLNGATAASLGLSLSSTGGVPAVGGDVGVKLTERTTLASLGTVVDWASGLVVTQGTGVQTADFSTAVTVQDVVNTVQALDLGVRFEINDGATGLDVVSEVSGVSLSLGENGGTTAEDLGLRTLGTQTALTNFRDGLGVEVQAGVDDFEVQLHDGTTFAVNLDGLTTVDEVVTAVGAAATGAGLTLGVDFDIGYAAVGNGLVLTDNTVGGNDFRVANLGLSLAADHLGLTQNAGAGATIDSGDQALVRVESVFTHLQELSDSLRNNDELGITLAGQNLEDDLTQIIQTEAVVGGQAKGVQDLMDRSEDLQLAEQVLLSNVQDADLTEVITRFTQLQQQLQATLQTGAQAFQLSLLDFLR